MKVHLIKKQTIENFILVYPRSKSSFNVWLTAIKYANWGMPEDIKKTFGAADLLGNSSNRVVFDIGGNNFRMICKYHFGDNQVHLFICWIGTHTEYDKICNKNLQYSINDF
jgi:mRNA interferase HigB